MNWTRTHALASGVGLILLVNAVALGGVAWNRSGEPDSVLSLSQRELLRNNDWYKENSGLSLRLHWRTPSRDDEARQHNRGWQPALDSQKMAELGFAMPEQVDDDSARRFGRQQSRAALLVLELNGPLHEREVQLTRKRLDEARQAADAAPQNARLADERDFIRRELDSVEKTDTRLLLKDVGLDLQALRARYPDRQRYLIVHGQVRPFPTTTSTSGPSAAPPAPSAPTASTCRTSGASDWTRSPRSLTGQRTAAPSPSSPKSPSASAWNPGSSASTCPDRHPPRRSESACAMRVGAATCAPASPPLPALTGHERRHSRSQPLPALRPVQPLHPGRPGAGRPAVLVLQHAHRPQRTGAHPARAGRPCLPLPALRCRAEGR